MEDKIKQLVVIKSKLINILKFWVESCTLSLEFVRLAESGSLPTGSTKIIIISRPPGQPPVT